MAARPDALDDVLGALALAGGDRAVLADRRTAHVVASGHDLLSQREIPGVELRADATADGIVARMTVRRATKVERPIHVCFGVMGAEGTQRITLRVTLESEASAAFVAHCFFPRAERVEHVMDATIDVGAGAEMRYLEGHYHGPYGGVVVCPNAVVTLGEGARYASDFSLTTGRVGRLAIDYRVEAGDRAVAELTARVFGHGADEITIKEELVLAGKASRGLIKTRVALEHDATAEVVNVTQGGAEGARGHIDCLEVVRDRAKASATPIVRVTHPAAKVTHEAAIGSVDRKQLETLMARGLGPEQAVDLIVRGMLR
jgi:Fe-S cluster assembly scaffold protein SufB